MAAPLAESFMVWRCKCGKTSFRHHEHCDSCGEAQPEPPPEAEKSDKSRPDPGAPVTGEMDMGLDMAIRTDYASHPGREDSWWSNPDGDGSYLSIRPVDGMLHVGDTVTVGDGPLAGRWVIVSQHTGDGDQEAQMQRADEP